jgi:hypothetical protein
MRHLRCTNARAHKSGGRQPAVFGKPDAVRRKSPTIRRRCDRRTRAAGVSPPWSVNRTQCGENRPPFDHDATHEQERRTSARRGAGNRICKGDRLFRTQHVPPGTIAFHPTAGSRQPLLVASADAVADVRFVSASPLPTPRLAHASRSWLPARMLLLMCVSYPKVRYPHHGWLTPAAPGCTTCAVVPENALATATDFSEPSTFAPARSVSIPRLAYASRSWLRDVCSVRNATFAMHKRAPTRAADVSPPRSVNRTQCGENRPPFDDDATHEQERRASARRGR